VISVCINNYNYERFLRETITSALTQEGVELEVIVVDDGSTDDSRAILESYGDRIRAVFTPNRGQGAALNSGFELAKGDIVVFLDADDVLQPGACERYAKAFEREPRPAKVQSRMAVIDGDSVATGQQIPGAPWPPFPADLRDHVRRFRSYPWPPSSANAYDVAALRHVMPIPEDLYQRSVDSYLCELMPYLGPIVCIDEIGVGYRQHGSNSYMGTTPTAEWLRGKMARVVENHERAVDVAARAGVPGPPIDPLEPLDVAFLGFRLASVRLDPDNHPFPSDRPRALGHDGIKAARANPLLTRRDRVIRVAWFALAGYLPRRAAVRVVRRFVPDSAATLRPAWLKRRRDS
jgi:glycosyltransferase involved in cell wall biosynthesis